MTGYGQPENVTNIGPAQITERTLRENFFPPFERAVKEHAGPRSHAFLQRDRRRALHANRCC